MGKKFNQLTLNDRMIIEKMLKNKNFSKKDIADTIGCTRITIYREIKKGTITGINTYLKDIEFYSSDTAHRITINNKKKQGAKIRKLNNKELMDFVSKKITIDKYSPNAIKLYIKKNKNAVNEYISDFTIYDYVKKGYFENITMKDLPYKKRYKKKYKKMQKRATFGESIEKRPIEILKREEFGHWEMDTVEGKKSISKKYLLVMTERKTRKELITLINSQTSSEVVKTLNIYEKILKDDFKLIFKSITMDNGSEFADTKNMAISVFHNKKIRTKLYYCHPSTPTERGSNENLNKMIRKYLPKGKSFDKKTDKDIIHIQEEINNYPRGIFNGDNSNERFFEELNNLNLSIDDNTFLFH